MILLFPLLDPLDLPEISFRSPELNGEAQEFVRENETHVEYHKNGETALVTTTTWKVRPTLQRVSADVFKSNVEQLLKEGYTISF